MLKFRVDSAMSWETTVVAHKPSLAFNTDAEKRSEL